MEDAFDSTAPDTQSQGDLDPPSRKPPTAVAGAAPSPSPGERPLAVRAWRQRPPTLVASAISTIFDVLDLIGDTIAEKTGIRSQV